MYCPKCGLDNLEDEKICKSCSEPLPVIADLPPEVKTSKLAIWSFVLSLMGLFTFMVTGLPAIICGIIGLVKISGSKGRLKGIGFSITGIVLPILYFCVILPILMAILMPALGKARQVAQRQMCQTHMKMLGVAFLSYTGDNNDVFPSAENWSEAISKYVSNYPSFTCAATDTAPEQSSYTYNINVAGKETSQVPPDTIVLFETIGEKNSVGGYEILKPDSHNGEGFTVLFADGHVEFIKFEDSDKQSNLRWKTE